MTVDREAVAEPEEEGEEDEEETARGSVCEERCSVGRLESGCLSDGTSMEENSLHRTEVVPAKRITALRMKTAGRCMECSVRSQASECDHPNSAGPDYGHAALRHTVTTKSDQIA